MKEPGDILKKYWGYDAFRPLQKDIIDAVLKGDDALALMPTGGGKSICFQVPSLAQEGICLVISPLIALMKDQVLNLKKKGIPALCIYSGMNFIEVKKILQNAAYGNFKFLYVSPERLETDLFLEFLPILKINLIAVDEAHCISQWGYDFRPPYLRIASIREYFPNVPVLALTASATLEVQKDICEKLNFGKSHHVFQQSFERANLSYSAFELSSKQNKLVTILKKIPGSGIVYCKSRKRTKDIADLLKLNGISADYYHAGLNNDDRNGRQEAWIANQTRVICCTNAFGMGIDKPDVRTVIHYDVPDALENYYQEAGRAGRDGQKSYAVLFYNEAELQDLRKQSDIRFPPLEMIRNVYAALCNYFQLPSGSGEGMFYEFDMNSFVKNFKLEVFVVNNVLKIFSHEELINYNEQFFSPSTVEFKGNRRDLELFEENYPKFDQVIKGLLRFYEGIFDYPVSINETLLAKFISINKDDLISGLNAIQRMDIIDYVPQKEKPQIQFLQNRVNAENLFINESNLRKRQKAFEKRLSAMLDFVSDTETCRSQMIASYFNDKDVRRCGICDNCLRTKRLLITTDEFNNISEQIKKIISEHPLPLVSLLNELPGFNQKKIKKVLIFLQEENKISVSPDGLLKIK
ncbi:MAG: ATP-dependent DNA helicase RecQ [Ginsengibacter sp.]|jgi:ATP-dependent DNA helicase RecQ